MTKTKLFAALVLFYIPFLLFSQLKSNSKVFFNNEIKMNARKFNEEINFNKAQSFFIDKKWDSTLVYSMKQLDLGKIGLLKDYCHYFRGYSFKEKKLLTEAKKEFDKIAGKFKFYYKVRINLGEIALEQNKPELALDYFMPIEKLSEASYDFKKSNALHNIGLCYLHLGKFDKAEMYLFKASKLQEVQADTLLLIGSYMDIATLYYEQFKDNEAIPYFKKAYYLSKKVKSFELKKNATLNMAIVEENRKKFLPALVYRKEYETWMDSLHDQNKVWALAELEKQFAVKQKQKELNVLEIQNKLKIAERNVLFISSILLLIFLFVGVCFYRIKVSQNKIILSQKKELDNLNATKDKLFSIVSHDLRSSVSALKRSNSKILKQVEAKNFDELDLLLNQNSAITNETYNLLENLLNWALLQTKQVYFQRESLHLHSIVEQVHYNYKALVASKNIIFENKISIEDYVFADQDSLKIIIRNLLDNAIKFTRPKGYIAIYSRFYKEDYCCFIIEDSGIGMSASSQKSILEEAVLLSKKKSDEFIGTGLGIQLCKSMIYKNEGILQIESEENKGTKIIVILPRPNII
jgi:signal transduction histidine kinase